MSAGRSGHGPRGTTPEVIWFGGLDRPLAGYLHVPRTPITGGVLVCSPFGYEATCAHRPFRRLADLLADDGNLVLRFDYEGTGASAGSGLEPDLLDRWQSNVVTGIAELRSRGVDRPALVGLRLGAALACSAAGEEELGPIVMWAPVTSGARYRRELRAFSAAIPSSAGAEGGLNVAGHVVSTQLSQELRNWQPLRHLNAETDLLLVQSPGWRDLTHAADEIAATGARPERVEVSGTAEVLERTAEVARVPEGLLAAIAGWLEKRPRQVTIPPDRAHRVEDPIRVFESGGRSVQEKNIAIGEMGSRAVLTEPPDRPARRGAVFLSNGIGPADGPARAWVTFSRTLTADDVASVRVDFSGIGNGPDWTKSNEGRANPTPRSSAAELLAAVEYLRDLGVKDVTVVGLCSGAHTAVRTVAYRGSVDSVVAINPALGSLTDIGVGSRLRRLWHHGEVLLEKRPSREVIQRLPQRWWAVLDRLGVLPSQEGQLRRAAERGCWVTLVFAEGDDGLVDLQRRAGRGVAGLVAAGRLQMEVVSGMDHSLFNLEARDIAFGIIRSVCLAPDSTSP